MQTRNAFVGRTRELDDVGSAFDDARAGRGSLFLLVGGAGIGKTRLADELGRRAVAEGFDSYWGRCWETGGAPVYWPWIQILRDLARAGSADALVAAAGAGAAAVGQLVPELAPAGAAADDTSDPAQARFRLFDAVTSVLKAASRATPLYLVLDDLHVSDPSSLALLHFVARNLRGLRALVVGTYRHEEARLSSEVGAALADVAREGTYLPLVPLKRAEIAELVTRFSGQDAAPALVESIERTTEGNPLFVDELLRLLVQRGDFASATATALPVPDTVREVIRRRAARLPVETRGVLDTGSVVGRDFTASVLATLIERDVPAVVAALEPALASGAIGATEPGAYRFSHVLVRETLYRELPLPRRETLHLRLATLLEARGDEVLAEVAHHRLAALPAGDAPSAVAAAHRAADRAMAMLAFEDAAAVLENARATLAAAGRQGARESFELGLRAGLAFMRAGQGERGRALCGAAASEARRMGDGDGFARAALAYGAELLLAQTDATLIGLLTEALARLPPGGSGLRAQVMARLASAQMPALDPEGPMNLAREAVAMARAADAGTDVLRAVLFFAGSALADYGEPAERAAISEELVTLARSAGDKVQILRGECRLVFDYLELGELDKSRRAVDAYEETAKEFRQSRHLWPVPLMHAMYALVQGRASEATRLLAEARQVAATDPEPIARSVLAWHALAQVLTLERIEDVDQVFAEMQSAFVLPTHAKIGQTMIAIGRAILLARFGDDRVEITRALAELPWDVPFLQREPMALTAIAEAIAVTSSAPLAEILYAPMQASAHRISSWGRSGFVCAGPGTRALALYAGTVGRLDEAIELLEATISRDETLGFRGLIGDARCWQAHFLARRSAPGDAVRARVQLELAAHAAALFGLRRLEKRIAGVRAALDARAATPTGPAVAARATPAGPPAFSLTREGDVWAVTAGARTVRVRDSRGMQMLAELVAAPGREVHALQLMGADGEGADEGDAGEVLDEDAIADYRARVRQLDDDLAEASAWNDPGRLARARAERDAISAELARGVGLGGRGRRVGGAAERARVNVQRRVRGAIKKIAETLPELAAYLDRTVRTGTFCCYEPY